MAAADMLQLVPARYMTIKVASQVTGYSAGAIEQKIHRGDWRKDKEWRHAPDGHILIDLQGYNKWVEGR